MTSDKPLTKCPKCGHKEFRFLDVPIPYLIFDLKTPIRFEGFCDKCYQDLWICVDTGRITVKK